MTSNYSCDKPSPALLDRCLCGRRSSKDNCMSEHPSPITYLPAVSVAIFHDGAFLLVKRGREPSKGLYAFPGGRVDAGESDEEAVRRELAEETGLTVATLQPLRGTASAGRRRPSGVPPAGVPRLRPERQRCRPATMPSGRLVRHRGDAAAAGDPVGAGDRAGDRRGRERQALVVRFQHSHPPTQAAQANVRIKGPLATI